MTGIAAATAIDAARPACQKVSKTYPIAHSTYCEFRHRIAFSSSVLQEDVINKIICSTAIAVVFSLAFAAPAFAERYSLKLFDANSQQFHSVGANDASGGTCGDGRPTTGPFRACGLQLYICPSAMKHVERAKFVQIFADAHRNYEKVC